MGTGFSRVEFAKLLGVNAFESEQSLSSRYMKVVGPVQVLSAAAPDQTDDMQQLQCKAFINRRLEKSSTESHRKRGVAVVAKTGPQSRPTRTLRN